MAKRSYSDEQKASALAIVFATKDDEGKPNYTQAAKLTGIPAKTLENWEKGTAGVTPAVANIGEHKKEDLADRIEQVAHALVDAIPGKVGEATLQQVATSLGIAIDKMQLLRGKATDIVDDASLTDEARASRVAALLEQARARRAGSPDPSESV